MAHKTPKAFFPRVAKAAPKAPPKAAPTIDLALPRHKIEIGMFPDDPKGLEAFLKKCESKDYVRGCNLSGQGKGPTEAAVVRYYFMTLPMKEYDDFEKRLGEHNAKKYREEQAAAAAAASEAAWRAEEAARLAASAAACLAASPTKEEVQEGASIAISLATALSSAPPGLSLDSRCVSRPYQGPYQ